ncbi:MAG: DUF167 domain-containing protein [Candidatus Desantisbacteria bacterium]
MKILHLNVKLQPSASKNEIVWQEDKKPSLTPPWKGGESPQIKIRVQSPPVDGKANKALINLLAKELGVKKTQVSITSGQTSRLKRVQVQVEDGVELPEWS